MVYKTRRSKINAINVVKAKRTQKANQEIVGLWGRSWAMK